MKKPILSIFLAFCCLSCGSGPVWQLRLSPQGEQEPSLVLLIRLDDQSRGEDPNALVGYQANLVLPPEGREGSFLPEDYDDFLRGCALEEGLAQNEDVLGADFVAPANSCIELGQYLAVEAFGGQGFVTETAFEKTQLRLSGSSVFVFILLFYPPSNTDFGNCFQLQGAEVLSNGFRIKQGSGFQITREIQLATPVPAADNCYLVEE